MTVTEDTDFSGSVLAGTSYVLGVLELDPEYGEGFRNYVPEHCVRTVEKLGATIEQADDATLGAVREIPVVDADKRKMLDAFLRIFSRNSGATEEVMHIKLGKRYSRFENEILPLLIDYSLIRRTEYRGRGQQTRYELNFPIEQILKAEDPDAAVPTNLKEFWNQLRKE